MRLNLYGPSWRGLLRLLVQGFALLAPQWAWSRGARTTELEDDVATRSESERVEREALRRLESELRALAEVTRTTLDATTGRSCARASLVIDHANQATALATALRERATVLGQGATSLGSLARAIHEQSSLTVTAVHNALRVAQGSKLAVESLQTSAMTIVQIARLTESIAKQTNLVALNATIEAASAGPSARGLAVVANEIKELAKETARATERITEQVASMQEETAHSTSAIADVMRVLVSIDERMSILCSAATEQAQGAGAQQRIVQHVIAQIDDIGMKVNSLVNAAQHAHDGAEEVRAAGRKLDEQWATSGSIAAAERAG